MEIELSDQALVSLATLRGYLDVANSDQDGRLTEMINWMSAEVCNYCNRTFAKTTYTNIYLDGDGSDTLLLPNYPIVSVSDLRDDVDRDFGEDSIIDAEDYMPIADEGIIQLEGDLVFSRGKKNIRVSFVAGYDTIPYDVQHAVLEWAATIWKKITEKRFGVQSVSIGDRRIDYGNEKMPATVVARLSSYRNYSLVQLGSSLP